MFNFLVSRGKKCVRSESATFPRAAQTQTSTSKQKQAKKGGFFFFTIAKLLSGIIRPPNSYLKRPKNDYSDPSRLFRFLPKVIKGRGAERRGWTVEQYLSRISACFACGLRFGRGQEDLIENDKRRKLIKSDATSALRQSEPFFFPRKKTRLCKIVRRTHFCRALSQQ